MIALLGSHGYIGSAFAEEMTRQGIEWTAVDYRNLGSAFAFIYPDLVINCAAFIPKTSVEECDKFKADTIRGNLLLPLRLSELCEYYSATLAQISTGYLWRDGLEHAEDDPPQRMFDGYCGFYIGTKVLAEEAVRSCKHYIWRLSLAFDERDNERNYLTKLCDFPDVFDRDNSVSHRFDFVRSCLELWRRRAPYGTYNVMNQGNIKATQIVELLIRAGIRKTKPRIVTGGHGDSKASVSKLLSVGIPIRSCEEAIEESINNWIPKT